MQTAPSLRQDDLIQDLVATASELAGTSVSADAPLMSAGLDSISATELSTRISGRLSTELPQTLLFDHPSLRSIASSLEESLEEEATGGIVPSSEPVLVDEHRPARTDVPVQPREIVRRAPAVAHTISMAVLEVHGTAVAGDAPLMSAGLDSIAATELANVLAERLGTELPQTVLFDHPTIGAVASFAAATSEAASVGCDLSIEEAANSKRLDPDLSEVSRL